MSNEDQNIPDMSEHAEPAHGWDWFDEAQASVKSKREDQSGITQEEFEMHFAKAFGGKHGKIVMSYLAYYVTQMPDFDPNRGFENGAASGFYRAGMRALVQHIHEMQAKGAIK